MAPLREPNQRSTRRGAAPNRGPWVNVWIDPDFPGGILPTQGFHSYHLPTGARRRSSSKKFSRKVT